MATEKSGMGWKKRSHFSLATAQKYPELGLEGSVGQARAGPSGRVYLSLMRIFSSKHPTLHVSPLVTGVVTRQEPVVGPLASLSKLLYWHSGILGQTCRVLLWSSQGLLQSGELS